MISSFHPIGIVVDIEQQLLQLTWNDNHVSLFACKYLRLECPCAECQPWAHGGPRGEMPDSVKRAPARIQSMSDVTLVGSYALTIRWIDGHATGIYSWDYLRDICPCEEHAGRKKE